jgi:ubiquinone/menaquinone biosynthesis C-methylase UbiE
MNTKIKNHKHTWIVTSIALVLAVVVVVLLPQNKGCSIFFIGVAGGHMIIALIGIFAGWILIPQKIFNKIFKKKTIEGFDFGWSPKWLYSFAVASFIVLMLAIHVYFSFENKPLLQLVFYSLLLLFAVNLFIGFVIFRNSRRKARITLPMVTLLSDSKGKVLDAGCGAGRTTIALAMATPNADITAFDKFDAGYIEDGGINLLKKNIQFAGIEQQVTIKKGDITATSFSNNQFEAIISSYMFDHLGPYKRKALVESFRILKPGGRFLLIIAIRSFSTFGIANILSLLFPSRYTWIKWIEQTGFKMVCDGNINEGAYFCFEKP